MYFDLCMIKGQSIDKVAYTLVNSTSSFKFLASRSIEQTLLARRFCYKEYIRWY